VVQQVDSDIRAGVVGAGTIGRVHIECLRRIGVQVSAVAGSTPERSRQLAEELDASVVRDAADLVELETVDVVHVCTPNFLHAEHARMALAAGKHIVCEKPLATSVSDCVQLVELAERSERVNAVSYNYRFYPMVQTMRAAAAHGELGEIHLIRGCYLLDEALALDPDSWMLDPERMGPSLVLADVGVHWWDLVEYVTGQQIREVLCSTHTARRTGGSGEDTAAISLRLKDGALALAAISNAVPGHSNTIELSVTGTDATATWTQAVPDQLLWGQLGKPVEIRVRGATTAPDAYAPSTLQLAAGQPQGYLDAFRDLHSAIYAAIAGHDTPGYPTFADGLRGVRVLNALIQSAQDGVWISV
jgi:predicted dehydrogenase